MNTALSHNIYVRTALTVCLLGAIGLGVFKATFAKFSSSASNTNNQFAASSAFPTPTPTITPTPTPTSTPTPTPTPTPGACQLYCQQTYSMTWQCVQNKQTCGTGSHNVGEKSPCSPPEKDCCCHN